MYVCMYVCMYVYMYVCIHTHTHTVTVTPLCVEAAAPREEGEGRSCKAPASSWERVRGTSVSALVGLFGHIVGRFYLPVLVTRAVRRGPGQRSLDALAAFPVPALCLAAHGAGAESAP